MVAVAAINIAVRMGANLFIIRTINTVKKTVKVSADYADFADSV